MKINIMGRLVDVEVVATDATAMMRAQRQWEDEKHRRREKYLAAIHRYNNLQSKRNYKSALDAIEQCSMDENSKRRLLAILPLIEDAPPKIFWAILLRTWPSCDDTWMLKTRLLRAMKKAGPVMPELLSEHERRFFEGLPAQVPVFRGCSRPRVRGISWTMERTIAEGFAHGHRGIRVPDPVVASALIPKDAIFFATDDRNEKEIVLNPRRLRRLRLV
jgi:hypothetical protein